LSSITLKKIILQELKKFSDDECLCPQQFDRMEIGWYINHSSRPNIAKKSVVSNAKAVRGSKKRIIHAIREIKAGDEILMDYNRLKNLFCSDAIKLTKSLH
jgi:SET domain-containing protein